MTPPTQALATSVLRAVPALAADHANSTDRAVARPMTTNQVLVLDTDNERQALLSDIVTRAGGHSSLAGTGAEALAALRDDAPNAVLVGGLPDGSTRGFVSWARPRYPDIAIVAIAADAAEATDLYNAGADVVTTLPLDPDLLGAEIAAALRRAQRLQLLAA